MKTQNGNYSCLFVSLVPGGCRAKLGIAAAVVLSVCSCSTHRPVGGLQIGEMPGERPVVLAPGAVAVRCDRTPGRFSFDKARGRTTYSGEGAANAARSVLDPPDIHDPGLSGALGPFAFAATPFAAAYGALSAHHATMSADKLSESESELAQTMAAMARQQNLCDFVLKAARERTRRRLVAVESNDSPDVMDVPASMVLETKIEELKLERMGSSDTSFALRIKARARLLRLADGTVLYDRHLQYLSGTALFLDWTCPESFRGVAETGYRELAASVAEQVFSSTADEPVLLGAGYKKAPVQTSARTTLVQNHVPFGPRPSTRLVGFREESLGQIGIYSTGGVMHVTLQKPLTRDDAHSEALSDVEWSLDGLENSGNSLVQLSACAVAIPLSLWKQTAATVRGLSSKRYSLAEAQLSAASQQAFPHEELALEVAQRLAPRTSQPVILVRKPRIPGSDLEPTLTRCLARGTLAWLPKGETTASYLATQGVDTALEIHVVSAALEGKSGINPPLALRVEATATLCRVRDSAELYSCPVHYRGQGRKFVEWADGNAGLFRQELRRYYRQMGNCLVEQLVARGVLAPGRAQQPTLANN